MISKRLMSMIFASLALAAWVDAARADQAGQAAVSGPAAATDAVAAAERPAAGQPAADQSTEQSAAQEKTKKPEELEKVTVTGSLIPRARIETANPTIQITAEDIHAQGFQSVYEALKSSPFATGGVQGPQDSGSFTQGAETLSLFGLDPNFTLTLINGHPLTEYPLLYNGESNFVDLSSIPTAMVDHIDIVPGNQSSIYGSAAIAGVINIVLKDHVEGLDARLRVGGYADGGGTNQRLSLVGGHEFGALQMVYGLQLDHKKPIWGYQRHWTRSLDSRPDGKNNGRTELDRLVYGYSPEDEYTDLRFFGPTNPHACDGISNLFDGTLRYNNVDPRGSACGSPDGPGYATLLNKKDNATGYLSMKLPLGDNAQAYADLLYNHSKVRFSSGGNAAWWGSGPDFGYGLDANTGNLFLVQWVFAPEEVGGYDAVADTNKQDSYNATLGVRGNFGASDWEYDAYYARSQQWLKTYEHQRIASKIDAFFQNRVLGPILGYASGYPVFDPDWSQLYTAITPADYRSFTEVLESRNQTWLQNLNFQLTNTNLFELPGGSAGLAAVLQVGNQHWSNHPSPTMLAGEVWGSTATSGFGTRKNYAGAVELNLPLWEWLTLDGSVRYDDYKFSGRSDAKATYKLGVELRPVDTLLIRANYATAFRAPDMARIYLGPSGFYTFVTDYYWCHTHEPDRETADCSQANAQVAGTQTSNKDLKDINAKSWGLGVVWSPTSDFNARVDYLDIKIDNEVTTQSITQLLRDEADCREGVLDAGSPTCVDALARVERDARGVVSAITVSPINVSRERLQSVTVGANYRLDVGRAGTLTFGGQYNNVLKHERQQYAGDPFHDLLNDPRYINEFKSILSADVTWDIGNFSTTLYGRRYGKWPNYRASVVQPYSYDTEGAGKNAPWMLYNLRVKYDLPENASISVSANNLFNEMPPTDKGYTAWPYYATSAYNVYGRALFVDFDVHFGG